MKDFPLAKLPWFEAWKEKTGEQEPDLSTFKSIPDLPELLKFYDGKIVSTPTQWEERKTEIKQLLCRYFLGQFPESIPAVLSSKVVHEHRSNGSVIRTIHVTFDTANKAMIVIEVMIPPGSGPFPVFLTQSTHRNWGLLALSRGYLVCVYPGADGNDQTDVFQEAYPDCDWSQTSRRAWLGSRALDYILTMREADPERVGLTGHSRNGKQSLVTAAFDERIKAIVACSSGSGGACPFRFASESAFAESVEFITRSFPDWYHPRLRFFSGREDKLPIDCHGLLGLIAPRYCLLSTSLNDRCESSFAVERGYQAAMEVYRFSNVPEALRIHWRYSGGHEVNAENIHSYLDWFDHAFSKDTCSFPEQWMYRFDWNQWKSKFDKKQPQDPIPTGTPTAPDHLGKRERILWGLGENPPETDDLGGHYSPIPRHSANSAAGKAESVLIKEIHFGEYIRGNLYYREDMQDRPSPVVVWLHPFSYPAGYTGAYVRGPRICSFLAEQGYTVMAFDQLGFGSRLLEGRQFYQRYPHWSRLGKMVRDVRSAVDFLVTAMQTSDLEKGNPAPNIDINRIYCLGYSLGGMVSLYAAALDHRIAGTASFCGFSPLRSDTDMKSTGGIRRLWEWYSLQPRLGLFHNREYDIPYDYDDILSLIAPRPCLVVSPVYDREADVDSIAGCITSAKTAWAAHGAEHRLVHLCPEDYNRFHSDQHLIFLNWFKETLSKDARNVSATRPFL